MSETTCYKIGYANRAAAAKQATKMRKPKKMTLRAYVCPLCGKYHLTSQSFDPKHAQRVYK